MPISALNGPGRDFFEKTCCDLSNTLKFRLAASKFAKNPDTFGQPIPKQASTQPKLSPIIPTEPAFFLPFSDFSDKQGQGGPALYPWFRVKRRKLLHELLNSGKIPDKFAEAVLCAFFGD